MIRVRQSWLEVDGQAAPRDRVMMWLDCHLDEQVNVEVADIWAFEASGRLRNWQGRPGVYLIGDNAVLDVNGLGKVERVREAVNFPHPEQLVVDFESAISLAITVLGRCPVAAAPGLDTALS